MVAKTYGNHFTDTILASHHGESKMKADNELQVPTVKRRPLAATARLKTHVHPFYKMSRSAVISVPYAEKKHYYVDTRERGGSEDMDDVENCSKEHSDAPS